MAEKQNQGLMKIVKAVHDFTVKEDLEKQRRSQANIGKLLGTKNSEASYYEYMIDHIPCEWVRPIRPHKKDIFIFYCHGGGFYTGSLEYARTLTTRLSLASSMELLSFNYRLAPEHAAPAALEDVLTVWNHLMHLGYGAKQIIVAGDSAGGNLALSLGLKLKEEGRILPRGFVLFSPWTNLTLQGKSMTEKGELDPILTSEYLQNARIAYVPDGNTDETVFENPYLSPIFGNYKDFPPVYIQVGSNEILLSDSTDLKKHMSSQKVNVKLDLYKGMWHVFQMANMKKANEAVDKAAQFMLDL